MAVQQCHILVLHRHWMVVGSRWLPTVPLYRKTIYAASSGGYEAVARLLLDKGADINAQGGYYRNALRAASWQGHEMVVRLLLDKGADVNAQGRFHDNALQAASWRGHEAVVRLLRNKGAVT
jgi:ankyrin repeat protein